MALSLDPATPAALVRWGTTPEQETLLIPLYAKAQTGNPLFFDPRAQDILTRVDYDFTRLRVPYKTVVLICQRAKKLDAVAKSFLAEHANGVVLHLGCGLDSRFWRVDNGRVEWYDLDMPPYIQQMADWLDDATKDNGCVHYVPGSHRWPLLPITGLAGGMEAIQTVLSDEQRAQFKPVAAELKKGCAAFHHPLMVHGSYANNTDRPRRAAVINVFRDGTRSASDHPLLHGVPPIPSGQRMDGQFFPLLLDPQTAF